MQRLKEETAQAHRETEQFSRGEEIMSRRLNKAGYIDILLKNYQLHQHFEPALLAMEGLNNLFAGQLKERMRTESLQADLRAMNAEYQPFEGELPLPQSIAQALGCMYVLEGSTLGGAVILRQLQQIPVINEFAAFSFYGFYGKELGKKWQEFGGILTNFAQDAAKEEEVVAFAKTTFEAARAIFSQTIERVES